jgi:hypothetical protein
LIRHVYENASAALLELKRLRVRVQGDRVLLPFPSRQPKLPSP